MLETTSQETHLSVLPLIVDQQLSGNFHTLGQFAEVFLTLPATQNFLVAYQLRYQVPTFFLEAFVHSSYAHEFPMLGLQNYEKLEFLGDSVVNLFFTNLIFSTYPKCSEGDCSKLRSALVNANSLALLARFLGLSHFILMGKGEFQNRLYLNDSIQADVLEALVGSIHLDQGPASAQNFLARVCRNWALEKGSDFCDIVKLQSFDAKTKLQEYCLKHYKQLPIYQSQEMGAEFLVELWINGQQVGRLLSNSKKKAQQILAQQALESKEMRYQLC